MTKFSVDYTDLQSKLLQKKAYRLSDVKNRIKKVAFDVVRFTDSDKIDDLWQIHRDGDDEYIVAMYDDSQEKMVAKSSVTVPGWNVIADGSGANVNVFYGDVPITKISLASMRIASEDAALVCNYLPKKLASDVSFFNVFVNNLSEDEREVLEEALPEANTKRQ